MSLPWPYVEVHYLGFSLGFRVWGLGIRAGVQRVQD